MNDGFLLITLVLLHKYSTTIAVSYHFVCSIWFSYTINNVMVSQIKSIVLLSLLDPTVVGPRYVRVYFFIQGKMVVSDMW